MSDTPILSPTFGDTKLLFTFFHLFKSTLDDVLVQTSVISYPQLTSPFLS